MSHNIHGASEILLQRLLVFSAPLRQTLGQSNRRERYGRPQEPRVNAAAAVEAVLGIDFVEVMHDARDLNALVLVQWVLKQSSYKRVGIEHEVFADQPAGVGQPIR